jgi:hypothetical protein
MTPGSVRIGLAVSANVAGVAGSRHHHLCGYIPGFPRIPPIGADIDILKRELPVDCLEFFVLTPLPGSEDHQKLARAGVAMEPDMNKYDLEHTCTAHGRMTTDQWQRAYHNAWLQYYSMDHIETLLRRAIADGIREAAYAQPCGFPWHASD